MSGGKNHHGSVYAGEQVVRDDPESARQTLQFSDRPRLGYIENPEERERQNIALPGCVQDRGRRQPLAEDFVDHHEAGIFFPQFPRRGAGSPNGQGGHNGGKRDEINRRDSS